MDDSDEEYDFPSDITFRMVDSPVAELVGTIQDCELMGDGDIASEPSGGLNDIANLPASCPDSSGTQWNFIVVADRKYSYSNLTLNRC